MKTRTLFIATVLLFTGCLNTQVRDEETGYPTGIHIDGKKQGEWKTFYSNGQIASIENYRNDTLNGESLAFHPDGKIKAKAFYKMGREVDSFKMFFRNGKPNVEKWKDSSGKTQGLFKVYYRNGQLSQIGYMKDDYLDDTCKTFFENGKLKTIEFYKDKKNQGIWQYFSDKGNLIRTEYYKDDTLISITNEQ